MAGINGQADVTTAAPLAAFYQGGVIYNPADYLDKRNLKVLQDHKTKYILVVGGVQQINDAVFNQLGEYGFETIRLSGSDRYATALAVANYLAQIQQKPLNSLKLVFATGTNTIDSLTAGPVAAHLGGAVILTNNSGLDSQTSAALSGSVNGYIIGGMAYQELKNSASPYSALPAYFGKDRYATAAEVFKFFFNDAYPVYLTTGEKDVDAVVAGPRAAIEKTGILLATADKIPDSTVSLLKGRSKVVIVGGDKTVGDCVASASSHYLRIEKGELPANSQLPNCQIVNPSPLPANPHENNFMDPATYHGEWNTQPPIFVYGTLRPGEEADTQMNGAYLEVLTYIPNESLWITPDPRGGVWPWAVPAAANETGQRLIGNAFVYPSNIYNSQLQKIDQWEGYRADVPENRRNYNRVLKPSYSGFKVWLYEATGWRQYQARTQGRHIVSGDYRRR